MLLVLPSPPVLILAGLDWAGLGWAGLVYSSWTGRGDVGAGIVKKQILVGKIGRRTSLLSTRGAVFT